MAHAVPKWPKLTVRLALRGATGTFAPRLTAQLTSYVAALGGSATREIGGDQPDLDNASDALDVLARLEESHAVRPIDGRPRPVANGIGAFDDLIAVIAGWWGVVLGAAGGVTAFSLLPRPVALCAVGIAISELAVHRRRSARIVTATMIGLILGGLISLWS